MKDAMEEKLTIMKKKKENKRISKEKALPISDKVSKEVAALREEVLKKKQLMMDGRCP